VVKLFFVTFTKETLAVVMIFLNVTGHTTIMYWICSWLTAVAHAVLLLWYQNTYCTYTASKNHTNWLPLPFSS